MNNLYKITGIAITIFLLPACKETDRYAQDKSTSGAAVPRGPAAVISPVPPPDYSLPAKTSANKSDSSSASSGKANPLSEMTKQEESSSMPLPRQANDHSSDASKTPK